MNSTNQLLELLEKFNKNEYKDEYKDEIMLGFFLITKKNS